MATVYFYLDFQDILEAKEEKDVNVHGKVKFFFFKGFDFSEFLGSRI